MEFNFVVNKDALRLLNRKKAVSGNCNSYMCNFSFSKEYDGLFIYAVFESGDECFTVEVKDGFCALPFEVLKEGCAFNIGIFATNSKSDDYVRISTNCIMVNVENGAYSIGCIPGTPELWEKYLTEVKEGIKKVEEIRDAIEQKIEEEVLKQTGGIVDSVLEALPYGDEVSY